MKKIYTLSVIDENGRIIAPSREISLNEIADSENDLSIGEGILMNKTKILPKDWNSPLPYRIFNGGTFQTCVCAKKPCNTIDRNDAIWIWERIA